MNSDKEYLYLDVKFNDDCTEITMTLAIFMYTEKLGLDGGCLTGEDALKFLKSTVHGNQPEFVNYSWLFHPDAKYEDFGVDLNVVIPSIKDVKFKHNKFDRKRRQLKTSMMSIPCVKIPKIEIDATVANIKEAIEYFKSQTSQLKPAAQIIYNQLKEIDDKLRFVDFLNPITPEEQTKMNTVYASYLKLISNIDI